MTGTPIFQEAPKEHAAFVASLLLTLAVGILQRFGFLSGASLLVPALMIASSSIGLILFSWRYQE